MLEEETPLPPIPIDGCAAYHASIVEFTPSSQTGIPHMSMDIRMVTHGAKQLYGPDNLGTEQLAGAPDILGTADGHFTTVIVRNIPAKYDQPTLLMEWPADGSFDMLYLPYNYQAHRTSGYALINFRSHSRAVAFVRRWHQQKLQNHRATKTLDFRWADLQGLQANMHHFKRNKFKRITNVCAQPMVFEGTRRLDFREMLAGIKFVAEGVIVSRQNVHSDDTWVGTFGKDPKANDQANSAKVPWKLLSL